MRKLPSRSLLTKYVLSYAGIALMICAIVGATLIEMSVVQLRQTAQKEQVNRLRLASDYLDQQLDIFSDIINGMMTRVYYRPYYFQRNLIYEMEMVNDLSRFEKYSPVTDSIWLLFQNMTSIYGTKYKYDFRLYARAVMGVEDWEGFRLRIESVNDMDTFSLNERDDLLWVVRRLSTSGTVEPAGLAHVLFVVKKNVLAERLYHVSGMNALSVYYNGDPLLQAAGDCEISGYTFDADGWYFSEDRLARRSPGGFTVVSLWRSETGSDAFVQAAFTILSVFALAFFSIAVLIAYRHYRPIQLIARKYDVSVGKDELQQIDRLLRHVLEENRIGQEEMALRLADLAAQHSQLRYQAMLLLLSGEYAEMPDLLRAAGLHLEFRYSLAVVLLISEGVENESTVIEKIERLSDRSVSLSAIPLSHDGIFAIIGCSDDERRLRKVDIEIEGSLQYGGRNVVVRSGVLCTSVRELPKSLLTAYYACFKAEQGFGINQGEREKLFSDLKRAIRERESERARAYWFALTGRLIKAYPSGVMRRSLLIHLLDELRLVFGKPDEPYANESVRKLFHESDEDTLIQYIAGIIGDMASTADEPRDPSMSDAVLHYIDENALDAQLSQESVSQFFGVSTRDVGFIIKNHSGMNYKEYIVAIKMENAKRLLLSGSLTVAEVCEKIGYANVSHFIKTFREYAGVTPAKYKKGK